MATLRTRTVKPSGGDYTSLSAWEAGEEADIVALDEIREAECYSMTDTAAVLFNGWTTDATRFIRIKTPTSERHDGKWNSGKYNLSVANNNALDVRVNHIRFEGLQVEVNAANDNSQNPWHNQAQAAGANAIWISQCIFRTHANASFVTNAMGQNSANANFLIWNTAFQDRSGHNSNRCVQIDCATCYFYNNTIRGASASNGTGLRHFTSTTLMKNCVVSNFGTCISVTDGTLTRTYSVSSDATMGGGTGNQNSVSEASMAFVDAANTDFHIGSGSVLKDAGDDLSGDANLPFSTDIDGGTRSGTWDIGVDEFVPPALATAPLATFDPTLNPTAWFDDDIPLLGIFDRDLGSEGVAIRPAGIGSAEVWGTPKLNLQIRPVALTSSEAWGVPTISGSAPQTITPVGIISSEAWGIPQLSLQIRPVGIVSSEAWGIPKLNLQIRPVGIASVETWGTPKLNLQIRPVSISSAEAWGTPKLNLQIRPASINSFEFWGSPTITRGVVVISPVSIGSGEAWGSPTISSGAYFISPASIQSQEAWGTPRITLYVRPVAISSAEAWGIPRLTQQIRPVGIASVEAWGTPKLNLQIRPTGISSLESWGTPAILNGLTIFPASIPSREAWGTPTITTGAVTISPVGIPSVEQWGIPRLTLYVRPNGIASNEQWGAPKINQQIRPTSINSAEAWGVIAIITDQIVIPLSLSSAEAWGTPTITGGLPVITGPKQIVGISVQRRTAIYPFYKRNGRY